MTSYLWKALLKPGLPQHQAHDALNDAVMAALAFIKLRQSCAGIDGGRFDKIVEVKIKKHLFN